jgi:large-conductance mechanosensitive channel
MLKEKRLKRRAQTMLDILFGIPPNIQHVHGATMSSGDIVATCIIAALVLAAAITLVVAAYRSVQRQSQLKEAEQPQVHVPEKEKILVMR